ncbi:putative C6 transcription factor [Aspergillus campestris IBT 28561]|uniref:C6 transcription factor n=1 Tax=Aspergillus campestris (strain IBT 28561) TaxID=1392248 RepID=A0A2I1DGP7_ASPC2|nr:putative C6 transcription factor [Aspergillus campestris IBT 28561]PKY09044.1 putative C6 transcription factor [Aspergillus campestris IBT 28561]
MSERNPELRFPSPKVPPRFFKACRHCRKQKMRCDARHQLPCSRCRSTGRDCILDTIENEDGTRRSGRQKAAAAAHSQTRSPWEQQQQQQSHSRTPSSREMDYSPVSGRDAGVETTPMDGVDELQTSQTDQPGPESQQLNPSDMMAPVSVVHSMSVNLLGSSNIFMENLSRTDLDSDVIARGIISEERARVMYERFMGGSKNFLPLFDPIRDTFDSIRSRSLFCFSVIMYLASRAAVEMRSDTHLQRVLQDEAQRLAEDSFFERPTKVETVQGMVLLAAYSEKTWFSTALILRTALDSGLEKSLDRLLSQENVPRSSLSATMEDRKLVWQTRTWLISFTLELDVASGTGRKSRIAEVNVAKLRKFLEYPLSLPCDMRTVSIIEIHQLRGQFRVIIENSMTIHDIVATHLPAIMTRLQTWWTTWDELHDSNGFHARAFQRCSLKLMLNYAKIFVLCSSLARIQKLQSSSDAGEMGNDPEATNLWPSLVTTIMDQLSFWIMETSYRYQFPWAPTYPALTVAFITTFALRIARWRPSLIDQPQLLEKAEKICDYLKQPPYPDIHRAVSLFVTYARALISNQCLHPDSTDISDQCVGQESSGAREPDLSLMNLPPPPPAAAAPPRDPPPVDCQGPMTGPTIAQTDKDAASNPANDRAVPPLRTPVQGLPGTVEFPNWTLSNSIADSFGLFEEEQNDIFDFLPVMPGMPQ